MKGVVFTEFIHLVEEKWGLEMVNQIIDDADDPHQGAYVSTRNYDHKDLVQLVVALHKQSGIPVTDLLTTYGHVLFKRLIDRYAHFNLTFDNAFDLLLNIETVIHTEVKKLHVDSNPPKFDCEVVSEKQQTNFQRVWVATRRNVGQISLDCPG